MSHMYAYIKIFFLKYKIINLIEVMKSMTTYKTHIAVGYTNV